MNKKIIFWWIIFIIFFITQFGSNTEKTDLNFTQIPSDFEYDGCSMFPDGDYRDCCTKHDDTYFFGGNWQWRLKADNELFSCVLQKDGWYHAPLAPAMWVWVRLW